MAAQPPFSTNSPRLQLLSALSATSWAGPSAAASKRSAHTAAASSLREPSAASWAVPPVVHPPQVKPTTMVATAHPAHDQNSMVLVGRLASQRWPPGSAWHPLSVPVGYRLERLAVAAASPSPPETILPPAGRRPGR